MTSTPYLSVIIPMYNEQERIGITLQLIIIFLKTKSYSWEIILVDDGSTDRSIAIAKKLLNNLPSKILRNDRNRGKGYSVKNGMLNASGNFLLFSDADLSTPIEEIDGFLEKLQHYDIVIGSRALRESKIEKRQSFCREMMGKIFNKIARLLTFRDINDSQCGFKCFRRQTARDLFSKQKLEGFSFDVEILYLAQKSKYRILEKPVRWHHVDQSRVKLFSDSIKMFVDIIRIRWLHR